MNIIVSISTIAFYGLTMIAFMLLLNNGEPTPLSESISKEKYGTKYFLKIKLFVILLNWFF